VLAFGLLATVQDLAHGVTTRDGGVSTGGYAALNLGLSTGDDPRAVAENRRRAAAALGFPRFVSARQVHGTVVREVVRADDVPGEADGLVTAVDLVRGLGDGLDDLPGLGAFFATNLDRTRIPRFTVQIRMHSLHGPR
jgi:hypothetical protein